jgi:hypothetical protein
MYQFIDYCKHLPICGGAFVRGVAFLAEKPGTVSFVWECIFEITALREVDFFAPKSSLQVCVTPPPRMGKGLQYVAHCKCSTVASSQVAAGMGQLRWKILRAICQRSRDNHRPQFSW